MGNITVLPLEECRLCMHYEREKSKSDNGNSKKYVMCKYEIDQGIEPFEVLWAEIFPENNKDSVRCPGELKKK